MEGKRVKVTNNKEKNKKQFNKFLKRYMIVLAIIMVIFLIHVYNVLREYETNQPENFAIESLKELSKNGKIDKYISKDTIEKSKYEKENASLKEALKEMLSTDITCKLNKESTDEKHPIYNIYSKGNLIFEVKLNGENVVNRLKLFSYSKYKIEEIKSKLENGIYTQLASIPSNYKLYINGKEVENDQIKEENKQDGLTEISKYTDIAHIVKYEIPNLYKEPEIEIKNEKGEKVEYQKEGNLVKVEQNVEKIANKDEALAKIKNAPDIMKIAEDWSFFLSDDLKGGTHGYTSISKYLIKDSYLSQYAYKWATGIDITFISTHQLLNPTFTEEKIENFEIYSENAFSCEVYLEKNMSVRGSKLVDKMHERMYFVYQENAGAWKLVNMQSK